MSLDFEKAFNRLDHSACISALEARGVDANLVGMVAAFLFNRHMTVKVGLARSSPRVVSGGAPQGSLLGPFLYCLTTDGLGNGTNMTDNTPGFEANGVDLGGTPEQPLMAQPPIGTIPSDTSGSDSSDGEGNFRFARRRRPILEDSVLSQRPTNAELEDFFGAPPDWDPCPPTARAYIDDISIVEKSCAQNSVSHSSTHQQVVTVHAGECQERFQVVEDRSSDLGMRINAGKTQLICISGDNGKKVTSYVDLKGDRIESVDELRLLGFWFGTRPGVETHVRHLVAKFRAKLWSLRHLRRSCVPADDMLFIYKTVLRPVIDFAAPSYHSSLTKTQSDCIEKLQRDSMKIICGRTVSYREVIDKGVVETLRDRRLEATRAFAEKNIEGPFSERWFPRKEAHGYPTRAEKPFLEQRAKTERMRNSPVYFMRRLMNSRS